ncbi:hypothetical protein KIN20_004076, partial [Parelaphostrongylus tenuis]
AITERKSGTFQNWEALRKVIMELRAEQESSRVRIREHEQKNDDSKRHESNS